MNLAEFLLARIDEDRFAQRLRTGDDWHLFDCSISDLDFTGDCDCGLPARVLAECEAKKAIIALHADGNADARWDGDYEGLPAYCTTCHDHSRHDAAAWPCDTLRALALPFVDHPDFDPAWSVT